MQEILNQEKSIYLQIKEMIERDILRDILLEEERVPSTNELAKLYAINPATAAKGINLLVEEGILYKKRGIGMFVAEGAKAAIMKKRKEHFFDDYIKASGQLGNMNGRQEQFALGFTGMLDHYILLMAAREPEGYQVPQATKEALAKQFMHGIFS